MRTFGAVIIRLQLLLAAAILSLNAVVVGLAYPSYAVLVLIGMLYRASRRRWSVSNSYGSAREAGLGDLLMGRLLCQTGLVMGRIGAAARPSRWYALRCLLSPRVPSQWAVRICLAAVMKSRRAAGDFIRINEFTHLATFAPAGGGKSVAVLYPNLLSYPGNCVVVDPKGEFFEKTARHRQREFGHTIVRLDPAMLFGAGGDSFNPLDFLDANEPDFIDQCRDLANMLVVRTGKEMDPHWTDSAENVITAFVAYICALEGDSACRNMQGVRTQIASRENFTHALEVMQKQEGFYGVLSEMGHSLSWHEGKELGSVMTHAQRFTNIYGAPLVAHSTSTTSFDPMRLRTGRMTIYLITPADKMVVWASLVRLWLGSLLRVITRGHPTERNPVLFLVDECAHIGKMQVLEDAVTLMRGMGIRLWLFFQSIEQLKKCFGENAPTVLDNLATQQYMSITSYETAEMLSKRIGDATVVIRTEGNNQGNSSPIGGDGKSPGSRNSGWNSTTAEAARRLYKPEEILVLPESTCLVFHRNNYVIVCDKIRYYADQAFRRRGLFCKRWGSGKSRGMGGSGFALGLLALALAGVVTIAVAHLPDPNGRGISSPFGGRRDDPSDYTLERMIREHQNTTPPGRHGGFIR